MPARGWWWSHFDDNGSHYKENNSYLAVWCKACTGYATIRLLDSDFNAVQAGILSAVRTEAEVTAIGTEFITIFRISNLYGFSRYI